MAKASIRKAGGARTRIVGPTLFTERTVEITWGDETARVYVEAWRQRSDGMIQSRIIRTRPVEGAEGIVTEHRGGAFRNLGVIKDEAQHGSRELLWLRGFLDRKGATITKERA